MDDHPMVQDRARPQIATMQIETLATAILNAIEDGFDSLQVHARSGSGKSSAGEYLSQHQNVWLQNAIPIETVLIPRRTSASDNALYKVIQHGLRSRSASRSAAIDRLGNIITRICDRCVALDCERFLLFVDEAQRLSASDYEFLANIYDGVRASGFRLFSVFLGQSDDCGPSRNSGGYASPARIPHLARRFFLRLHVLHGLRGLEEITYALSRYDAIEHMGIPFPATFAPTAYAAGWRLTNEASKVVEALKHLRAEAYLSGPDDLAMSTFEPMVRRLLVRVAGANPAFSGFTLDDVIVALRRAEYSGLEDVRKDQVLP